MNTKVSHSSLSYPCLVSLMGSSSFHHMYSNIDIHNLMVCTPKMKHRGISWLSLSLSHTPTPICSATYVYKPNSQTYSEGSTLNLESALKPSIFEKHETHGLRNSTSNYLRANCGCDCSVTTWGFDVSGFLWSVWSVIIVRMQRQHVDVKGLWFLL